jgi:hypothetical protein
VPAVDEIWVLGQSLYKNYYMIHDPDMRQIAFVPTEKKLKTRLPQGVTPQRTFRKI